MVLLERERAERVIGSASERDVAWTRNSVGVEERISDDVEYLEEVRITHVYMEHTDIVGVKRTDTSPSEEIDGSLEWVRLGRWLALLGTILI